MSGIPVEIVRKRIKNLHLGVYPPDGRVRVAAPVAVSDDAVRLAVIGKLAWIRRQQAGFASQDRQGPRTMVSGESHYFLGRRYRLQVIKNDGSPALVRLRNRTTMELHVPGNAGAEQRQRTLERWYRQRLREIVPAMIAKWTNILGVRLLDWRIKKMKTKWGTCTVESRRVWLNLELAKKPVSCIEYLVVHELTHLLERHHNERFISLMDRHLPNWRRHRQELNAAPLGHATWGY